MQQLVMSDSNNRKFFLCSGRVVAAEHLAEYPNNHVMGELCYRMDEGKRVTALARWDVSISTKAEMPIKPDIDVYLIGDARDIKCRCPGCTNKERWEIGQAAIKQILSKYYVSE